MPRPIIPHTVVPSPGFRDCLNPDPRRPTGTLKPSRDAPPWNPYVQGTPTSSFFPGHAWDPPTSCTGDEAGLVNLTEPGYQCHGDIVHAEASQAFCTDCENKKGPSAIRPPQFLFPPLIGRHTRGQGITQLKI